MGIQGLMKLISEECPEAVKEHQELESFTGRRVAIDASMAMYQFLIAVRSAGQGQGHGASMLMNEAGEVTSHIQGMFNRTIKLMTSGIKPVYVFDGKPPQLKGGELAKRMARRAKAEAELEQARDAGAVEEIDKFSRRLVKVTKQHNDDCKELLRLMGVPVVDAPCEAEAQCAELAKNNKVYATATEDMDALTFQTPKLLRKLTYSQSSAKEKQPILEIDFAAVLRGMKLTYEQFVDLCILCGCDYCSTIKGVGPKTALKLIRQHQNLETVVKTLKKDGKYEIPPDWLPQKVKKNQDDDEEEQKEEQQEGEKADEKEGDSEEMRVEGVEGESDGKVPETVEVVADNETACKETATDDQEAVDEDKADDESDIVKKSTTKQVKSKVVDDEDEDDLKDSDDEADNEQINKEDIKASDIEKKAVVIDEDPVLDENDEEYEIVPPLYVQARKLFVACEVFPADDVELKWTEPNEEKLKEFLIERMGFNADRVVGGIKRLKEAQQQKSQKRLDSFFAPAQSSVSTLGQKRKAEEATKGKAATTNKKPANKGFAKKR